MTERISGGKKKKIHNRSASGLRQDLTSLPSKFVHGESLRTGAAAAGRTGLKAPPSPVELPGSCTEAVQSWMKQEHVPLHPCWTLCK